MKLRSQRGFSLVELMIVVAIIGILSAIAVPSFQRFQRKARQAEVKAHLSGIYTAEKAFFAEWNTYYQSLREVGYQTEGVLRYNAGFSGGVGAATLTAAGFPRAPDTAMLTLSNMCSAAASNCRLAPTVPAGLPGGSSLTRTTFVLVATGDIGGAAADNWTIDQQKTFANTQDGVQ